MSTRLVRRRPARGKVGLALGAQLLFGRLLRGQPLLSLFAPLLCLGEQLLQLLLPLRSLLSIRLGGGLDLFGRELLFVHLHLDALLDLTLQQRQHLLAPAAARRSHRAQLRRVARRAEGKSTTLGLGQRERFGDEAEDVIGRHLVARGQVHIRDQQPAARAALGQTARAHHRVGEFAALERATDGRDVNLRRLGRGQVHEGALDAGGLCRFQLLHHRTLVGIDGEPSVSTAKGSLQLARVTLGELEDVQKSRIAGIAREQHLLGVGARRAERGDLIVIAKIVYELEDGAAAVEGVGAVGDDELTGHHLDCRCRHAHGRTAIGGCCRARDQERAAIDGRGQGREHLWTALTRHFLSAHDDSRHGKARQGDSARSPSRGFQDVRE